MQRTACRQRWNTIRILLATHMGRTVVAAFRPPTLVDCSFSNASSCETVRDENGVRMTPSQLAAAVRQSMENDTLRAERDSARQERDALRARCDALELDGLVLRNERDEARALGRCA